VFITGKMNFILVEKWFSVTGKDFLLCFHCGVLLSVWEKLDFVTFNIIAKMHLSTTREREKACIQQR